MEDVAPDVAPKVIAKLKAHNPRIDIFPFKNFTMNFRQPSWKDLLQNIAQLGMRFGSKG
jgi:hypothetical protein